MCKAVFRPSAMILFPAIGKRSYLVQGWFVSVLSSILPVPLALGPRVKPCYLLSHASPWYPWIFFPGYVSQGHLWMRKKKTLSLYSIILYTVICYPHNFIVSSIFVLLIASIPSFSVSLGSVCVPWWYVSGSTYMPLLPWLAYPNQRSSIVISAGVTIQRMPCRLFSLTYMASGEYLLYFHGGMTIKLIFFFRLLLSNCLNWKIYCDDHSSLST